MGTSNYVQANDTDATNNVFFRTTVTMEVKCPYSGKCIDFKKRCDSCKHNERRSYYEPDYPYRDYYPWYPYYPNYPNYPYYPDSPYYPHYPYYSWSGHYYTTTTVGDTGDDLTMPTTNCYEYTA